MFTDVVGYTALTQRDEVLAMTLLEEHRTLVRPFFLKHNGREVKTIGDAFLVEFESALDAVRCSYDMQRALHELNSGRTADRKVQLRIGIHLGDVVHSQSDVYGDAVNVASRIQSIALPEGVCISVQVYGSGKPVEPPRPSFAPTICPRCKEMAAPGMVYCPKCAAPLDQTERAS
jgi:class 3 adenylate cyclase